MANMIPISTVTVGSGGVATISFTNIPQTYTDLVLKMSLRVASAGADSIWVMGSFNGSSSSFSIKYIEATGSAVGSYSDIAGAIGTANKNAYTSSTFSNAELYIPNYTSSNYKSYSMDGVTENNATVALIELAAGLWSNTSPINSISLTSNGSGNFVQYSSATLYGIRKY